MAVLVAAGLAGGAGYALNRVTHNQSADALVAPPQLPTATPSLTASPTLSPTPRPVVTRASPTPSPTPSPTASPTPSPTPPRTYAYPSSGRPYAGLTLSAKLAPRSGNVRTAFAVRISGARDGDGTVWFDRVDWGDGTVTTGRGDPTRCRSWPPLTSPPGPYRPEPDAAAFGPFTHRYPVGVYTVTVRVRSSNGDCKPHGPSAEVATATFTDVVVSG